jgi:hypothetical protein
MSLFCLIPVQYSTEWIICLNMTALLPLFRLELGLKINQKINFFIHKLAKNFYQNQCQCENLLHFYQFPVAFSGFYIYFFPTKQHSAVITIVLLLEGIITTMLYRNER